MRLGMPKLQACCERHIATFTLHGISDRLPFSTLVRIADSLRMSYVNGVSTYMGYKYDSPQTLQRAANTLLQHVTDAADLLERRTCMERKVRDAKRQKGAA